MDRWVGCCGEFCRADYIGVNEQDAVTNVGQEAAEIGCYCGFADPTLGGYHSKCKHIDLAELWINHNSEGQNDLQSQALFSIFIIEKIHRI